MGLSINKLHNRDSGRNTVICISEKCKLYFQICITSITWYENIQFLLMSKSLILQVL